MDTICNYNDAMDFLRNNYDHNTILKLGHEIQNYQFTEEIQNDISHLYNKFYNTFINLTKADSVNSLQISAECFVLHNLHDRLMPFLYSQFGEQDNVIFNRCKHLNQQHISPEQLGASTKYTIPFSASIVELASLDIHKTAIDKINCLCASYDFLFAELKLAMVEVIAESGNENDIPIIENSEVVPLLMFVVIKAKLQHLYSNLFFVHNFGEVFMGNKNISEVLVSFQIAIQRIIDMTADVPVSENTYASLDLIKFNNVMCHLRCKSNENTVYGNSMKHVTKLISDSHTSN